MCTFIFFLKKCHRYFLPARPVNTFICLHNHTTLFAQRFPEQLGSLLPEDCEKSVHGWMSYFDQMLGPHGRKFTYFHILPNKVRGTCNLVHVCTCIVWLAFVNETYFSVHLWSILFFNIFPLPCPIAHSGTRRSPRS